MQELEGLKFSNPFADLPEDLFHKQNWTPFDNPKLIHFNNELAELLGFPKDLNAMIHYSAQAGVNSTVLSAAWNKNLEVRKNHDWLLIEGAITKEIKNE